MGRGRYRLGGRKTHGLSARCQHLLGARSIIIAAARGGCRALVEPRCIASPLRVFTHACKPPRSSLVRGNANSFDDVCFDCPYTHDIKTTPAVPPTVVFSSDFSNKISIFNAVNVPQLIYATHFLSLNISLTQL